MYPRGVKIDRSTFLALTATLAAATASAASGGCGGPAAPGAVAGQGSGGPTASATPLVIAPVDAGLVQLLLATDAADGGSSKGPDGPVVCPENAVGTLVACANWKIDPTCESADSARDDCTTLIEMGGGRRNKAPGGEPEGFQPRVAERIAQCMTAKPLTRATGCKRPDMHKCIREAVDTVCVHPDMTQACETIVAECNQRGRKPTFSVAQCARIATSTRGPLRDWALQAMSGHHFDGTPMGEGCTLQYITVYQPWPKNWWGSSSK